MSLCDLAAYGTIMRLVRFGPAGAERPGLIDAQGNLRDLSRIVSDIAATTLNSELLVRISQTDRSSLPLVSSQSRLGPPVAGVGKFIAIGLNYRDHAEE